MSTLGQIIYILLALTTATGLLATNHPYFALAVIIIFLMVMFMEKDE